MVCLLDFKEVEEGAQAFTMHCGDSDARTALHGGLLSFMSIPQAGRARASVMPRSMVVKITGSEDSQCILNPLAAIHQHVTERISKTREVAPKLSLLLKQGITSQGS